MLDPWVHAPMAADPRSLIARYNAPLADQRGASRLFAPEEGGA